MKRVPADVTVERSSLGGMKKLGRGGQATVFKLEDVPPVQGAQGQFVFKKYHKRILDESAGSLAMTMPQLILHPDAMSGTEQKFLRKFAVWPQALVVENGLAEGIVMKLIPDPYFFDMHFGSTEPSERLLLEAQYLLVPEAKKREQGIPTATAKDRLLLLMDVLRIVEFFHQKELVIGDFSPKNLIVTNPLVMPPNGKRKFYPKFLDVDAFRFAGGVPPIKQMHTPNWFPSETLDAMRRAAELTERGAPEHEISAARAAANTQTTKSDIFKMGLFARRLFHIPADPNEDDTQSVRNSPISDANIKRLVKDRGAEVFRSMLDTDPNSRPTASEVLAAFRR